MNPHHQVIEVLSKPGPLRYQYNYSIVLFYFIKKYKIIGFKIIKYS